MNTIALLTDFGCKDWYVGVMKSVIIQINPDASIIDISHEITPQNITEASFVLWNAYDYFPEKTIFVCVVDPGVGSKRNIVAVQTAKHIFLAPDNGLLDLVLPEVKVKKAVAVENMDYFLNKISNTFHGRDIFAPVAAHLSNGLKLSKLGSTIDHPLNEKIFSTVKERGDYEGNIIYIDRYGNLITNLKMSKNIDVEVRINNFTIRQISKTYADVEEGALLALTGSSGLLEISVRNGNAKKLLEADYNMSVFLKTSK